MMSLRGFHIFFIVISIALAVGFGLWCFSAEKAASVAGAEVMGVISLIAAGILVVYGVAFLKKLNREGIR